MDNSFASVHPELVSEWSDRNALLSSEQVTYGSNKMVWWKANCGHEWEASPKSRSVGENCPVCSGKRIVPGINDLCTLRLDLSQEWSERNLPLTIIRGYFLSHLLWLIVGMLIAGAGVALSVILSGLLFDKNIDIFNYYVLGIGISLFTGAFFFPLFYSRNGEERNEAFLAISLLCGIGIIAGLATLMNAVFPTPMSNAQIIIVGIIIMAIAVFAITISCFLTISIYRKRDY